MSWDHAKYHLSAERRRLERGMVDIGLVGARVMAGEDATLVQVALEDLEALVMIALKARRVTK